MTVDYTKLKAGDKVRYLGGDNRDNDGALTVGKVYEIIGIDSYGDPYFEYDKGGFWDIFEYNVHCFELVDDEGKCKCDIIKSETKDGITIEKACKYSCKHDSHIASLAKEVAELKRELTRIYDVVFESNEKHRRNEDDIVLLDERLIEVESNRSNTVKEQYFAVYGSEYIDKLFGGDSE